MRLTVRDRIVLPEMLPESGDMLTMILRNSISRKVEFTPREITDYELRSEGGALKWNAEKVTEVEVAFEEAELDLLRRQYREIDEGRKVTGRNFETMLKLREL